MNAICLLAALPLLVGAVPTATASAAQPPTEVLFFLDAEDYTDPDTADSIKRFADLFAEEGVKAHFAIVGFLADQLVRWGRQDVLASLRPHLVGTQTMYHSRHPDICEITDVEDFSLAYHRVFDEERRARDAVRSATGGMDVWCAVPPGDSKSYAAYYAWADLGIPFVCDTVVWNRAGDDLWYCNIRQLRYDESIEWLIPGIAKNPPAVAEMLDAASRRPRAVFYAHPHIAVRTVHWDAVNYNRTNSVPWGEWKPTPRRSTADTETYFSRVRDFVRTVKGDPRFIVTDLSRLPPPRPRVPIKRADLPRVKASLEKSLGPVDEPASWCVADVFQAVVGFLRGEGGRTPGKVYGFLSAPRGVAAPAKVSRADLVHAAKSIDLSAFLPPAIRVGKLEIGPADFLFAALEALTTDANEITVMPREQLGNLDDLPELKSFRLKGTWVHTPGLEDRYLSDRMRLQLWTLRRERSGKSVSDVNGLQH